MSIICKDKVYGNIEISDPIILDLINCPSIQRLKKIDSAGYYEPFFPGTRRSRFDHSIGVYLLLKIYGASIEEQIAGLIHDVSHSAFSHCIDYVLSSISPEKHDYQDNIFEEFVRKSEIPEILKKYNFDLDYILDDKNFLLKERNIPDLCADRIDYLLRDSIIFKTISDAKYFLDNLIVSDNNWVFKNFESAEKFAQLFLHLNVKYYSGLPSATMFQTVSDYLKHALKKEYIKKEDLYDTDDVLLKKIEPYLNTDLELKNLFDRMNNRVKVENNPNDYKSRVVCKSRVVDPFYLDGGQIKRISETDSKWIQIVENELKPKEYFLKFEK